MSALSLRLRKIGLFGLSGVGLLSGVVLGAGDARASVTRHPLAGGAYEIRVHVDGVQLRSTKAGVEARLTGVDGHVGQVERIGAPAVPVVRLWVAGDVQVETLPSVAEGGRGVGAGQLPAGARMAPVLAPFLKVRGQVRPAVLDGRVYGEAAEFPAAAFSVENLGSVRRQLWRQVTLHPFRYNPTTGGYRLDRDFRVVVRPRAGESIVSQRQAAGVALVVGAAFAGTPEMDRLVALKKAQGLQVAVGVMGRDFRQPAEIRAWLQRLLGSAPGGSPLRYAILVGDHQHVPASRGVVTNSVTDHYYAAIDTTDYGTDIGSPDIQVGRFSVNTAAELGAVIDKLARFLQGGAQPGRAGSWRNRAAWLATDDKYEIAEGTHNYVIGQYFSKLGFLGDFPRMLPGGDQIYAITHRAKGVELLSRLKDGFGWIDYSGHGATNMWAAPRVTQEELREALTHPEATPIVISNACITGDFTVAESFAETWQRHPRGAVAVWASTDNTMWDEDDILEKRFFDGVFRDKQVTLGAAMHFALAELWKHYGGGGRSRYYWEVYTDFGDPATPLRQIMGSAGRQQ